MRHGLYCGALGALALALSLAGAQPAPADNPNCQTQVFPFTSVGTNPCTGEQIAVAGTVTTTVCAVTDATGAVHGSVALQIAGMGVGDQGNSYTIQGPSLTAPLDTNAQGDSESLDRVHTNFISQGEAPDFVENCEIHIAIHNTTVQTIQRDDCTAECSGEGPVPPP